MEQLKQGILSIKPQARDPAKCVWNQLSLDEQKFLFNDLFIECINECTKYVEEELLTKHSNINMKMMRSQQGCSIISCVLQFAIDCKSTQTLPEENKVTNEFLLHGIDVLTHYLLAPFSKDTQFTLQTRNNDSWNTNIIFVETYDTLWKLFSHLPSDAGRMLLESCVELCLHPELYPSAYLSMVRTISDTTFDAKPWKQLGSDFTVSFLHKVLEALDKYCQMKIEDSIQMEILNFFVSVIKGLRFIIIDKFPALEPEAQQAVSAIHLQLGKVLDSTSLQESTVPKFFTSMCELIEKTPQSQDEQGAKLIIKLCQVADQHKALLKTSKLVWLFRLSEANRSLLMNFAIKLAADEKTHAQAFQLATWCLQTAHRVQLPIAEIANLAVFYAQPDRISTQALTQEEFYYTKKLAVRCCCTLIHYKSPIVDDQLTESLEKLLCSLLDNRDLMTDILTLWPGFCDLKSDNVQTLTNLACKIVHCFTIIAQSGGAHKLPFALPIGYGWSDLYTRVMAKLHQVDPATFETLAIDHFNKLLDTAVKLQSQTTSIKQCVMPLKFYAFWATIDLPDGSNLVYNHLPDQGVCFIKSLHNLKQYLMKVTNTLYRLRVQMTRIIVESMTSLLLTLKLFPKLAFNDQELSQLSVLCSMKDVASTEAVQLLAALLYVVDDESDLRVFLICSWKYIQEWLIKMAQTTCERLLTPMVTDAWRPWFEDLPFDMLILNGLIECPTQRTCILNFMSTLTAHGRKEHTMQDVWFELLDTMEDMEWPASERTILFGCYKHLFNNKKKLDQALKRAYDKKYSKKQIDDFHKAMMGDNYEHQLDAINVLLTCQKKRKREDEEE